MEIIARRERARTDKLPTPALRVRETVDYLWLCPECRRAIRLPYNRSSPLPSCMGSPPMHVKQLLVCESEDIYRECFFRWMKRGESLGRPVIYPRNAWMFPVLSPGESRKDFAEVTAR